MYRWNWACKARLFGIACFSNPSLAHLAHGGFFSLLKHWMPQERFNPLSHAENNCIHLAFLVFFSGSDTISIFVTWTEWRTSIFSLFMLSYLLNQMELLLYSRHSSGQLKIWMSQKRVHSWKVFSLYNLQNKITVSNVDS